ncbi:hypothetical protein [Shewanella gaetbuli]|uniref:Lipoprotein n=1 Tax=Shewanella gaetbuli TaxID=220752 RepID=A0A9X1ZNA3_9GAMM|nr:hypothetical protein [Shewanella gaetbuli]MCL1142807.1 hypothetical protein [Shewanella gaetbuli]
MKRILVVMALTLLAGCSSNTASKSAYNAGCDFVSGAYGNQQSRQESESAPGYEPYRHNTKNNDVASGVLSALFGLIARPLSDNDDCV